MSKLVTIVLTDKQGAELALMLTELIIRRVPLSRQAAKQLKSMERLSDETIMTLTNDILAQMNKEQTP